MKKIEKDKKRYRNSKPPRFQVLYRNLQDNNNPLFALVLRLLFSYHKRKNLIDLYYKTEIGPGLYIGHPYCISINSQAKIGSNCNIHKGVTIGQENRGKRKGAPFIGNDVWIGVNSTIVGSITTGKALFESRIHSLSNNNFI